MIPAKMVCSREPHVREMIDWGSQNGDGHFSFIPDSSDLHWTTVQAYYDISLNDWLKSRQSHEMFLFNHLNTAFSFKMRFA
jgi:hypothetical protein